MKKIFFIIMTFFALLSSNNTFSIYVPHSIHGVTTININQAKHLHHLEVLFLDIRSHEEWSWGHIKHAHNLPLGENLQQLRTNLKIDKNTPLVIYGSSSNNISGALASYLSSLWGYNRVFFMRDGYYEWLAKDYPVFLKSHTSSSIKSIVLKNK